jgi:hypothetical protein
VKLEWLNKMVVFLKKEMSLQHYMQKKVMTQSVGKEKEYVLLVMVILD